MLKFTGTSISALAIWHLLILPVRVSACRRVFQVLAQYFQRSDGYSAKEYILTCNWFQDCYDDDLLFCTYRSNYYNAKMRVFFLIKPLFKTQTIVRQIYPECGKFRHQPLF